MAVAMRNTRKHSGIVFVSLILAAILIITSAGCGSGSGSGGTPEGGTAAPVSTDAEQPGTD